MTDSEWVALISNACAARPAPVRLVTYRNWVGDSLAFPAAFADADGVEYIVKSPCHGPNWAQALVTEQVVSAVGRAMGAPVADARLVELPQELLDINQESLAHFQAGVCHGSRQLPNVRESREFLHTDQPENRPRFAALAALFGWTLAADHQFLYELAPPNRVHSHDHGMFLPGHWEWSPTTLSGAVAAVCDVAIVMGCHLTADELRPGLDQLGAVVPAVLADAVALPPDEWGIAPADRLALAKYLASRQADLLAQISRP